MKKEYSSEELRTLILQEKKAVTRELIDQAWDEAATEEIENSIIADVCVNIAIERLASDGNRKGISRLIKRFKSLDELGLITSHTTLQ